MSPFAEELRQLRFARGLRQQDLANLAGCERWYLSALENDVNQAPEAEFVDVLSAALSLSADEAAALHAARRCSRRNYSVPPQLPQETYRVVNELFLRIEQLSALQLQGLMAVLRLGQAEEPVREHRIRRKDRRSNEREGAM